MPAPREAMSVPGSDSEVRTARGHVSFPRKRTSRRSWGWSVSGQATDEYPITEQLHIRFYIHQNFPGRDFGVSKIEVMQACLNEIASRITPAVQAAQAALADAMAARDRECKGGVGKFCREREAAVIERRQSLDMAMQSVGQAADPQTDAAVRIVAWATHGVLKPTGDDFAMLRLVLLALLPQIGGILIMVGRLV
jgi:hypothetical protein